jgi:uncharacterized membrane protein
MNIYGIRKFGFAVGAFLVVAFGLYAGAIPAFNYLQDKVPDVLNALIWLSGIYIGGNVGAKGATGLAELISKIKNGKGKDV